MSARDDGGPAFPSPAPRLNDRQGMTLRTYAAIKLCVPDSGIDWLDDMIRQSQRDRFAGQAMAGIIPYGEQCANARLSAAAPDMLAALKKFRTKVYNAALGSGMDHEWATEACSVADAAIAKAEGGAA